MIHFNAQRAESTRNSTSRSGKSAKTFLNVFPAHGQLKDHNFLTFAILYTSGHDADVVRDSEVYSRQHSTIMWIEKKREDIASFQRERKFLLLNTEQLTSDHDLI